MSKAFTEADVRKLADLSRIAVDDAQVQSLKGELATILQYVSELESVSVSVADPSKRTYPVLNVLREDIATNPGGTFTDAILQNAPTTDGQHITVKKIL